MSATRYLGRASTTPSPTAVRRRSGSEPFAVTRWPAHRRDLCPQLRSESRRQKGRTAMLFMHHVLAVMALLGCAAAAAATIDVTTRNDEFGSTVSLCSLRGAVQAANTNAAFGGCPAGSASGFDVINLPAGRYQLDLGGLDENANAEG